MPRSYFPRSTLMQIVVIAIKRVENETLTFIHFQLDFEVLFFSKKKFFMFILPNMYLLTSKKK
jgi:hypothetical protein